MREGSLFSKACKTPAHTSIPTQSLSQQGSLQRKYPKLEEMMLKQSEEGLGYRHQLEGVRASRKGLKKD